MRFIIFVYNDRKSNRKKIKFWSRSWNFHGDCKIKLS